MVGVGPPLFKM